MGPNGDVDGEGEGGCAGDGLMEGGGEGVVGLTDFADRGAGWDGCGYGGGIQ